MPSKTADSSIIRVGAELGKTILREVVKYRLFEITVLTPAASKYSLPSTIKIIEVDFTDLESLTEALTGQDAVVSALQGQAILFQKTLIDAAVVAGVKRFIPSEYGYDLTNAKVRTLTCWANHVEIEDHLKHLAAKGDISYTFLYTGVCLDMALRIGIFFNFREQRAHVFDGGDQLISATTVNVVGKAIRRILSQPLETANRVIRIREIDISQNELLAMALDLHPGNWDLYHVGSAQMEKDCLDQMANKEESLMTGYGLVKVSLFSEQCGNKFEDVDNGTLGIAGMTRLDLEELFMSMYGKQVA